MELKWLDDYLALIETGSLSAAAEKRHVSQPAFSRRIQMLESWLGVSLRIWGRSIGRVHAAEFAAPQVITGLGETVPAAQLSYCQACFSFAQETNDPLLQ